MQKPTFFLSSTIYDFIDLRGAIKYYLEEQGCIVLASECNDFGQPLDEHSYDACLKQIERADYFILLIGARVGGWFDAKAKVSITQKEYRTAYDLQLAGKIKIITFVRSEVWNHREELKALAAHLSAEAEAQREKVLNYPNKFMTDASFISVFIDEVTRNKETHNAVANQGEKPKGNWVHQLTSFRDIVSVINPLVFSGRPIAEMMFRRSLQHDLIEMVRKFVPKSGTNLYDPYLTVKQYIDAPPLSADDRDNGYVSVDISKWHTFSSFAFSLVSAQVETTMLRQAIATEYFMVYDRPNDRFEISEEYRAIAKLIREMDQFNERNTSETMAIITKYSPRNLGRKSGEVQMEFNEFAMFISLVMRWANIYQLSAALIKTLTKGTFIMPDLLPFSPLKDYDHRLEAEYASYQELETALGVLSEH